MNVNRFLIGATKSGIGKTTLSLGLMRTLAMRGLNIQPFKVGPDRIDPIWHERASGAISINLDGFMLDEERLLSLVHHYAHQSECTIIEGVMGLYDGIGTTTKGSSAFVAKLTNTPVILVIDGDKVSTSIAATILGFKSFDPDIHIAGIILNQVNSEKHYELLKKVIKSYCDIPILGRLPFNSEIKIPSRVLGLTTQKDLDDAPFWQSLMVAIETHINIDQLLAVTKVDDNPLQESDAFLEALYDCTQGRDFSHITLAVAKDEVFEYYFEETFALIKALGVKIVPFSPLKDKKLPICDALYIGKGNISQFSLELSQSQTMRQEIFNASKNNLPIYAECDGLIYLSESLEIDNHLYPMAGIFKGKAVMQKRLQNFGYCYIKTLQETLIAPKSQVLRGHNFHYYVYETDIPSCYSMYKKNEEGETIATWQDGYQINKTLGHLMQMQLSQNSALIAHWLGQISLC